ncbi:TPA: DUF551 domain-containing protein [Escherichia coli]|nr:DUF551 domain-containing protein [Escherichia coli O103]EFC2317340.1 DUF551 domain-containing protein [Escherichia coli]EGB2578184.1 DUF551 domain-containing protein [Escherichia coli]EJJ1054290.1 DUF551 domain-containing protein [Escherichia coli]ELX6439217.1 DUF551 domain-containing protein [Escherichia coli]
MITITKEFTKEQLIEQAKKNIEVLRGAVERVPGASDAAVIHLKLAEITLASLEAEPVAKIIAHYPLGIDVGKQKFVQAIGELPDFGGYLFAAPPAPIALEAIENAIEYIRSIAFHIDEDDYHGKHIAYFMRQALAWLEGYSCSDDRLGKAENQTVHGNQAAESNRGNEWTGNPDIDNAIIMLDRIDTLESCDDDRIEAVKAVLRRLAGNSPVTPDGWISCSERMPDDGQHVIILCDGAFVLYAQYRDGEFFDIVRNGDEFFETQSRNVTDWMPLPEPPQEVNQ